jgi:hypothetical protein
MHRLIERQWSPAGVTLPKQPLSQDTSAAIIRITGGNFRPLNRLLTQIECDMGVVLKVDSSSNVTVYAGRHEFHAL